MRTFKNALRSGELLRRHGWCVSYMYMHIYIYMGFLQMPRRLHVWCVLYTYMYTYMACIKIYIRIWYVYIYMGFLQMPRRLHVCISICRNPVYIYKTPQTCSLSSFSLQEHLNLFGQDHLGNLARGAPGSPPGAQGEGNVLLLQPTNSQPTNSQGNALANTGMMMTGGRAGMCVCVCACILIYI